MFYHAARLVADGRQNAFCNIYRKMGSRLALRTAGRHPKEGKTLETIMRNKDTVFGGINDLSPLRGRAGSLAKCRMKQVTDTMTMPVAH
ncbi:MAG: hypothetical protein ACKVQJ_09330 [Pyrinomonadaceae bacterium]